MNRNKNIGEKGVNMDMASFRRYLKTMTFNDELVRACKPHAHAAVRDRHQLVSINNAAMLYGF